MSRKKIFPPRNRKYARNKRRATENSRTQPNNESCKQELKKRLLVSKQRFFSFWHNRLNQLEFTQRYWLGNRHPARDMKFSEHNWLISYNFLLRFLIFMVGEYSHNATLFLFYFRNSGFIPILGSNWSSCPAYRVSVSPPTICQNEANKVLY